MNPPRLNKYLNLGCGNRFHKDWINMDYISKDKNVIQDNLLNGVPFMNNTLDVVYHSHLIEHFTKNNAVKFTKECYRVLKIGGVIRIATPNLEKIVRNYLKYLSLAPKGDIKIVFRYDWTLLELFDQCVRSYSGGEMGDRYKNNTIHDPEFVRERMGIDINLGKASNSKRDIALKKLVKIRNNFFKITKYPFSGLKNIFQYFLLGNSIKFLQIGMFRTSGEVHFWLYDKFSLSKLLTETGFRNIKVCRADESRIMNWSSFNLDTNPDGTIYKPDSFYMEAEKLK